jgi:thioredoxin-like negative regulator of GroEL
VNARGRQTGSPLRHGAAELARVQQAGGPALVVFGRPRSRACRLLAPLLEEIAAEFAGRAAVVCVDDLDAGALAERHGVREVPTVTFWSEGEERTRIEGTVGPAAIRAHLEFLVKQRASHGESAA